MLLLLINAVFLHIGEAATAPYRLDAAVVEAVTNSHKLSEQTLPNKYDCAHEGLALAIIGNKCKHSSIYMEEVGKGENFITYRYRLAKKPSMKQLKVYFGYAVEDWIYTVEEPLSSDVVYTDTSMEPFANMVYNKTLYFGCSFLFCNETSKIALACVYDNRPKIGEPLYWADSKNNAGCQKPGPCKKVIKGTDVNCDTTYGLCDQDPATTTTPPGTTVSTDDTGLKN